MGFADAVRSVLSKYVVFDGRACRSEFWYFVLFQILLQIVIGILTRIVPVLGLLSLIVALGLFLPGLAVAVRRMHDIDKSGWWLLLGLVPIVGLLVIVWYCLPGTQGPNRFGDNPLGGSAPLAATA